MVGGGVRMKFNRKKLAGHIDAKNYDGYILEYRFSNKEAFGVNLDWDGKVADVSVRWTLGDLLK